MLMSMFPWFEGFFHPGDHSFLPAAANSNALLAGSRVGKEGERQKGLQPSSIHCCHGEVVWANILTFYLLCSTGSLERVFE